MRPGAGDEAAAVGEHRERFGGPATTQSGEVAEEVAQRLPVLARCAAREELQDVELAREGEGALAPVDALFVGTVGKRGDPEAVPQGRATAHAAPLAHRMWHHGEGRAVLRALHASVVRRADDV